MEINLKALSVVEPWGTMIADKAKLIELRTWQPDQLPMLNVALVQNKIRLTNEGDVDPLGFVVAIVDIVACSPWTIENSQLAGCTESEFENGWLAWELTNIRKLSKPVKATAKRKIYSLSDSESSAVKHWFEPYKALKSDS